MPLVGVQHTFDSDTDSWYVHKKQLEQLFIANAITNDNIKRAILLNGLSAKAYKLADNLVIPNTAETTEYAVLIRELDKHFDTQKLVMAERYNFYATRKNKNESYAGYLARLKDLAADCQFGNMLTKVLRDKFVAGLEAGPVLDKLLQQAEGTLTADSAVQLAQQTEMVSTGFGIQEGPAAVQIKKEPADIHHLASRRCGRAQHRGSGAVSASGRFSSGGGAGTRGRSSSTSSRGRWRQGRETSRQQQGMCRAKECVRCGGIHSEEECSYREFRCHKCGRKGHLRKMCRSKHVNFLNCTNSNDEATFDNNYVGSSSRYTESEYNNGLFHLSADCCKPLMVDVFLNGKKMQVELDSGAATSVCSEQMYLDYFRNIPLEEPNLDLVNYVGGKIVPIGKVTLDVEYSRSIHAVDFFCN
ncbi:hypothetical protein NQ315_014823 [Exocentrus adspersus]|uniref:CCHC-type domain-containing protein n=1 Tax=Exocentrus adspersus TaxID=1586481 RepID=A0AAV8VMA7_9CUCU|nr:hypothetical protein NQ315_014823 [Exocentrus adspersus]